MLSVRPRVACADDHPVVRAGLRAMIDASATLDLVGEAATAAATFDLVRRLRPDVLVIDVRLPDGDGIEVAARCRQSHPDLHVLVLSTFAGDETVHRALQAGARGFILKEHAEAELLSAIHSVAEGRRYLPRAVAELLILHGPRVVLTGRERDVLAAMARNLRNKEIGRELGITEATARTHVESVRLKFHCRDRQSVVAVAATRGFLAGSLPPPP